MTAPVSGSHSTGLNNGSSAPLPSETGLPPLSAIPADIQRLQDYERYAARHLSAQSWAYLQSGEGDERSLADNRRQFDAWHLIPRRLHKMQHASTAITLFGLAHETPFMLAPVAYHRIAHAEGEIATMRAATALGVTMVVSTLSSIPLESIALAAIHAAAELNRPAPPPLWFQLYAQPDKSATLELVRRAEAAGYQALVFTVDAASKRSDFTLPPGVSAANLDGIAPQRHHSAPAQGAVLFGTPLLSCAADWATLGWLRSETKLPLIIKGLLSPDDAMRAVEHGANGVIISNHGGRVLDGLIPPLNALPAMRDAVEGRVPILLDSGVRTGSDIIKALALGASACLIGRPQIHALAVAGTAGVAHLLHMLRAEVELTMAQLGTPTVADITQTHLAAARR